MFPLFQNTYLFLFLLLLFFLIEALQNLLPQGKEVVDLQDVFGILLLDKVPEHLELVRETLGRVPDDPVVDLENVDKVLLLEGLPLDVVVPQLV